MSDSGQDSKNFLEELKKKDKQLKLMRAIEAPENQQNSEGKLKNIPFVAKDAICTKNVLSSAGSEILKNYKPVFDATVIEKLKQEGAQFYGKTNQDEFGFGTFSTNCAFETPRNPHDPERAVGGSSGGAGAVPAATETPIISVGESTGGSITNPAAYNGVIGITPTYGRVSRNGLIDYANSLDKIGILSQDIELVAKGLEVIAGHDENDQTTSEKAVPKYSNLEEKEDLKLAIPKQYIELDGLQEGVKENFQESVEKFEEIGYQVDTVDMPLLHREISVPAYYIIAMAEASTNLAKMSGMRYGLEMDPEDYEDYNEYFSKVRTEGFGEEAIRRILVGTYTRQAGYRDQYYIKAAKVRTKIINQFKQVFEEYDAIISPSMPNIAPKIEEAENMAPEEVYAADTLTVGPNFAGMPMISVPNGKSQEMPTGLHIIGNHFEEKKILDTAHTYIQNEGEEK